MKILLHACCGPCSLEPVRLLNEVGHDLTIAYMNSNIHPVDEYELRRDTLFAWAAEEGIPVIEGSYDPGLWERVAGAVASLPGHAREGRCRACYRIRFAEVCAYAAEHGFDGVSTTLSVSPYQFTDIVREELEAAGSHYGLDSIFEDFRPHYQEATRRSKELGMYRQNYCGCRLSEIEAAVEREERRQARKEKRNAEKARGQDAGNQGADRRQSAGNGSTGLPHENR